MELSRRDILKSGAILAAGAMGATALAGCSSNAESTDLAATGEGGWDREADIVIVGAGMGGMCAGVQALENGVQNVLVVEISRHIGGSTSFSFGTVHAGSAGTTEESYNAYTQGLGVGHSIGSKSVMETPDLQNWLADMGMPLKITEAGKTSAAEANSHGHDNSAPRAHMIDEEGNEGPTGPVNFFRQFSALYEERGGQLLTETEVKKVLQDEYGNVIGVLAADKDGNPIRIGTTQVILATGGFQNDEELKQRYFGGPDSYMSANMSSPYLTGSGMRMALECGASLQGDMAGHAGEWVCAQPAKNWMADVEAWEASDYNDEPEGGKWWLFSTIVDNLAQNGILVNLDGKRFCDELGSGHVWERFLDEQRLATAHMICDQTVWDEFLALGTRDATADMAEKLEILTSDVVGGAYYTGNTVEELADNMNAAGIATHKVHKGNLVRTIAEYNEAAANGTGADLEVPRVAHEPVALSTPPYYALPIRNAVFVCFGGVAINEQAQVLDGSKKPIRGLYATCPCAGGFMYDFYCGSISTAGVSGRWAANAAAAALSA